MPAFQSVVLEISDDHRTVSVTDLPVDWQAETQPDSLETYLTDWLAKPDNLTVSVPSAIVSRSRNYLIHTLHPDFRTAVRIVENIPFAIDTRLLS